MDFLSVGLAGFLGAVCRALLAKYIKVGFVGEFPVSTLIINLTGCFVLCFFMRITLDWLRVNPKLRLAVGTGFCGAYTTFSTFSLESINLLRTDRFMTAFAYIILTSLGCVLLGWLGAGAGRALSQSQERAGQS